jgi:hypothetical protein
MKRLIRIVSLIVIFSASSCFAEIIVNPIGEAPDSTASLMNSECHRCECGHVNLMGQDNKFAASCCSQCDRPFGLALYQFPKSSRNPVFQSKRQDKKQAQPPKAAAAPVNENARPKSLMGNVFLMLKGAPKFMLVKFAVLGIAFILKLISDCL